MQGGPAMNPFTLLAAGLRLAGLALLATLVMAVTVQVIGRYLFLRGVPYTDEIAQMCLTWCVFIAAPLVYRRREHITVELPWYDPDSGFGRILAVVVHTGVVILMLLIVSIGIDMRPMMVRIQPGALPVSRFTLHFLPLIIGAGLTAIFALEAICQTLKSHSRKA